MKSNNSHKLSSLLGKQFMINVSCYYTESLQSSRCTLPGQRAMNFWTRRYVHEGGIELIQRDWHRENGSQIKCILNKTACRCLNYPKVIIFYSIFTLYFLLANIVVAQAGISHCVTFFWRWISFLDFINSSFSCMPMEKFLHLNESHQTLNFRILFWKNQF